jgi:HK97 family phage major capsid protein/HK97 family phage prohead protease
MKRKFDIKNIKPQFRELTITKSAIDVANRTIEIAFVSELPVERYFGMEILDCAPSSVRLGRITDGGPLLVNHNIDEQVGVVESVKIGSDRIGRAIVRFGKGEYADEIFNDVVDGIRTKISVGYQIFNMILETEKDGLQSYRITDWEPYEISVVSIPADNGVGVGRSTGLILTNKDQTMEKTPEQIAADAAALAASTRAAVIPAAPVVHAAPAVNVTEVQNATRAAALAQSRELIAIGERFKDFGGEELARQHISEGKTPEQLSAAILERAAVKKPVPTGEIGLTEGERKHYSFLRIMNALANPTDAKAQKAAAFELECSHAARALNPRENNGITIPYDVLLQASGQRILNVGQGNAGGYTVDTQVMGGSFIEILRKRLVTANLGATVMNGLTGNIAIPRQNGAGTAYWVAEGTAPTGSQQSIDQVTMSPKTVGAYTDYSRKLLIQSSIDVENMVRNDLSKIIALEIDRVALYGTGSATQPTGIKNTAGIYDIAFTGATPTFAEIVSLETAVAAANADLGTLAYAVNASMRGALKTAPKVSGYPTYIWDGSDTPVNGYRTEVSNQVASGDVFYGNWSELMIGFWSGLDLLVDPYSNSTSGTIRVVALQDTDIAVRHPVSFVRGNNAL